jgi:hypothetical protein
VFHVEIRQFPHVARGFNLTAERLQSQIVARWARDEIVDFEDRRWAPERAKLTIYDGPQLRPDELGLGRGWGNATRQSTDVTERVLAAAAVAAAPTATQSGADAQPPTAGVAGLKQRLLAELEDGQLALSRVAALAGEQRLGLRASQRLALAEQAIWELLHEGRARLIESADTADRDRWEAIVLAWTTWASEPPSVFLAAPETLRPRPDSD